MVFGWPAERSLPPVHETYPEKIPQTFILSVFYYCCCFMC